MLAVVAAELTGVNKDYRIKITSPAFKSVEVIAPVANINYLATRRLSFKFAGERQERRYVAAGPASRQNYSWYRSIH